MESSPLDLFRLNDLFRGHTAEAWDVVRPHLQVERFAPGRVIFDEGDAGDSLYLIGAGVVRISKAGRGGRQETLTFLEAGDYFGDMAAFTVAPRSARATSLDEVTTARVDRRALEALMKASPLPVVENLARRLIDRLRTTNEHFVTELLLTERLSLVGSMAEMIVHDLRNALNPANGYVQLLRGRVEEPQAARWIERVDRSIHQAVDMLEELLEFSRGAEPVLRLERVELQQLFEEIDEQYLSTLAPRFQLRRDLRYTGPILVDRLRLNRVIINLCRNAVEAMRDGGTLTVASRESDQAVTISITDTGCGIPPELLPRIFEPFVTHGKENGTGLGMAIVRSVVDSHGGTISVESVVGEGTTVRIRLPSPPAGDS